MKFPGEWLLDSILDGNDNKEQGIKFVEDLGWEVEHKFQNKSIIFEYENKFYCVNITRTGNDFNGWEQFDEYVSNELKDVKKFNCTQVVKIEVVTHQWKGLGANI